LTVAELFCECRYSLFKWRFLISPKEMTASFNRTQEVASDFCIQATRGPYVAIAHTSKEDMPGAATRKCDKLLIHILLTQYLNSVYHDYFQKRDVYSVKTIDDLLACGHFQSAHCLLAYLLQRCIQAVDLVHDAIVSNDALLGIKDIDTLRRFLTVFLTVGDGAVMNRFKASTSSDWKCSGCAAKDHGQYNPNENMFKIEAICVKQ